MATPTGKIGSQMISTEPELVRNIIPAVQSLQTRRCQGRGQTAVIYQIAGLVSAFERRLPERFL